MVRNVGQMNSEMGAPSEYERHHQMLLMEQQDMHLDNMLGTVTRFSFLVI